MTVTTGLDHLVRDPDILPRGRIGLLTNHTGMTAALGRGVDALYRAGLDLAVLIGPEHGLSGTAQAGASENSGVDTATGLPVVDAYHLGSAVEAALTEHEVETLVVDMQDVGVRYWTYAWTMYDAMVAAALAELNLPGVLFREADFRPTFHKYARQAVHGAQLYVSDHDTYCPVSTGLAIIQTFGQLYPDDFLVLSPRKEAEGDNTAYPLDRLWGSDGLRFALTNNFASSGARWYTNEVRDPRDRYGEGVILYPDPYGGVGDLSIEARLGP